ASTCAAARTRLIKKAEDAVIVDARGMRCPWPVLRAARVMRRASHVVLLSDDAIARKDVPEMATARGWCCEIADEGDVTRFTLRARS
ncbi:MAG: sulfurtransferase TusA family protein, partial [Sphingobium sp.]